MHFNEMCVKSRQLGLTFVAAALGVGLVLLSRGSDFSLTLAVSRLQVEIHVSVLIVVAAAFALAAVRILDLHVYHKMLRGAVTFGEDFEENYMKQIFDLDKGMTQAISHFSRHENAAKNLVSGKYMYTGTDEKNAEMKIRRFYKQTIISLVGVAIALLVWTNLGEQLRPVDSKEPSQGVSEEKAN
jgi:hypothetical protein